VCVLRWYALTHAPARRRQALEMKARLKKLVQVV